MTSTRYVKPGDPAMPSQLHLDLLVESLADTGIDVSHLIENSGLNDAEAAPDELTYLQFRELVTQSKLAAKTDGIGFIIGSTLSLMARDRLDDVIAALRPHTVMSALQQAINYRNYLSPLSYLTIHKAPSVDYLRCVMGFDYGEHMPTVVEICFSSLYQSFVYFCPERLNDVYFEFAYPPPAYADEYIRHLNGNIRFNAEMNRVIAPHSVGENPILYSRQKPISNQVIALPEYPKRPGRLAYCVELLNQDDNIHNQDQLADALFMSISTLKRKLAEHGISFQQLRDTARMYHACELLESTEHNIVTIAKMVGYSDSDCFRDAFKRWTNQTPSDYREHVFKWVHENQ